MLLKGYIHKGFIKQIVLKNKKPESSQTPRNFFTRFRSIKVYDRRGTEGSDVEVVLIIPNIK